MTAIYLLVILIAAVIIDGIEVLAAGVKSEKYCDDSYSKTFSLNNPTTVIEEFPFMASLGYEDAKTKKLVFDCAGILISEKYVLTAAGCADSKMYGKLVQVKLGIANLNGTNNEDIIQTIAKSKMVLHPNFKGKSQYYNVGLIELQQPIKLTKHVKPICMENKKKLSYPSLVTASLGMFDLIELPRLTLKGFKLIELDNAECEKHFKKLYNVKDEIAVSLICAKSRNDQEDPCIEVGSPLIAIDPAYGHRVVGVTSFGKICGFGNYATVFYRVSNYIEWIESILWP